jgi:ABC-type multidrug transport system ATPase subunit
LLSSAGFEPSDYPIEIRSVDKTYPGGLRALRGVSFVIGPSERVCLLGPNGAGKTTLIRLLTGVLEPTAGTVRLFGRAARDRGFLAAKRRVGIVPQAPGMYRDLTASEYLTLVRKLYGRGRIETVVEDFGLGSHLHKPMADLSGGYQRRLVLAGAVLSGPDLLLLDEPTVGLDPLATREVRDRLQIAMRGRATLLCTHNLAEAEALCDAAVILREGRVLLHERLTEMRGRFESSLVLRAAQGPEALAAALARWGHGARVDGDEVHLATPDPSGTAPELLRALLAAGLDVYECRALAPSLEDLFLDAVQNGGGHARG